MAYRLPHESQTSDRQTAYWIFWNEDAYGQVLKRD